MQINSAYSFAVREIRTILSQDLDSATDPAERLEHFSAVFGTVPLATLTDSGYQDILSTIDAMTAPAQAYLTNLLARITVHLKMTMLTEDGADQYQAMADRFSDVIGSLEDMELFDRAVTERISYAIVEAGGAMILYLCTMAFRELMTMINEGVHAHAVAARTDRA